MSLKVCVIEFYRFQIFLMGRLSRRARHLKKAREIQAQKLEANKNDKKQKINEIISEMDKLKLDNVLEQITKLNNSEITKERCTLYTTIDELSEMEVKSTNHLLSKMRYPKGKNQGRILFTHLQDKAAEFITCSIYKPNSSVAALAKENSIIKKQVKQLEKKNSNTLHQIQSLGGKLGRVRKKQTKQIAKIHSNTRKKKPFSSNSIKSYLNSLFLDNERHYSSKAMILTTRLSQIGRMSFRDTIQCTRTFIEFLTNESASLAFSLQSIICWNKEISELKTNEFLHCNNSKFYTLGILADESTRGSAKVFIICFMYWNETKNLPDVSLVEMKDLITCDAKTVAQTIIDTCNKYSIDIRICQTFLSDNTNYMAGKNNGAVKLFAEITKN